MGFDLKKFNKTKFQPLVEAVPVPELVDFFDDCEPAEIEVRQLGAPEYARAEEEVRQNKLDVIRQLATAAGSGNRAAIMEAVGSYFGDDGERLPDDVIKRMYLIEYGTDLDHAAVVKLKDTHAEVFYRLSNKVLKLTQQAPTAGELKGSGKTRGSKERSGSGPAGAASATS